MSKAKIIVASIAVVLMIIVVAQNTQSVETRILFVTLAMPRAVLLMLTFGIGAVVGLLVALTLSGKKKTKQSDVIDKNEI